MKTLILISIVITISISSANGQANKVIKVNSAQEFIEAIGPNRTIQLKGNTILLSEIDQSQKGKYFRFDKEFDGKELVITGVNNLIIKGLGEEPVEIITKPVYGDVIVFENCNNIRIENVDAGHGPEKGGCTGGVFNFVNSNNITIHKSIMYGSGMEGISASDVTNLKCTNSTIHGCTYSIMSLSVCKEFEFDNCSFNDNQEFDMVNISECKKISFKSCKFYNNSTGTESYSDYALFNIDNSESITLNDCKITNNTAVYFCNSPNGVKLNNTKFTGNSFVRGEYKKKD